MEQLGRVDVAGTLDDHERRVGDVERAIQAYEPVCGLSFLMAADSFLPSLTPPGRWRHDQHRSEA